MDESTLASFVNRCYMLQTKFGGIYPADVYPCPLPLNTFIILNTSPSNETGQHWVVFANRDGCHIFADPLGFSLWTYPLLYWRMVVSLNTVNELVSCPLQSPISNFCGLWCIFLAYIIFAQTLPINVPIINEEQMLRFINHSL